MKDKEYFKILAEDVMIEFTDDQLIEIAKNNEQLIKQFEKVTKINTDGVKPLYYPYEDIHDYLRDDNEYEVMEQKTILSNAPASDGDFVTIVKVVK